jgi:hypothetical protein
LAQRIELVLGWREATTDFVAARSTLDAYKAASRVVENVPHVVTARRRATRKSSET